MNIDSDLLRSLYATAPKYPANIRSEPKVMPVPADTYITIHSLLNILENLPLSLF